jgi:hypothetical protein
MLGGGPVILRTSVTGSDAVRVPHQDSGVGTVGPTNMPLQGSFHTIIHRCGEPWGAVKRAHARKGQRCDLRFYSNRLATYLGGQAYAMARGVDELTVTAGTPDSGRLIPPGRRGRGNRGSSLTRPGPISTLVQSPLGAVAVLC